MDDDLTQKTEEIKKYVIEHGFNIFHASSLFNSDVALPVITWNNNVSYKKFFDMAKKDGVDTIIFESDMLTDSQIEKIDEMLKKDMHSEIERLFKNRKKGTKIVDFYTFAWVKNGLMFALSDETQLSKEITSKLRERDMQSRLMSQKSYEKELPKELEAKPIEEIGDELMEWFSSNFPGASIKELELMERSFWDEKGVDHFSTKGRLLSQKVSLYVNKKLLKKEKEGLPKIENELIQWVTENKIKRLLKQHIDGFLTENGIDLTKNARDILYTRINTKLGR